MLLRTTSESVQCTSTTAIFYPMTQWLPTINVLRLRVIVALVNKSTNLSVQLAIQTATTDTSSANAPVALGAAITTVGRAFRDIDVGNVNNGEVNSHMWCRIGILAASSGSTVESGNVSLTPSYRDSM